MRIAILPLFGMPNFRKDSNWREWVDLIHATDELDLGVHWYFLVPKIEGDYEDLPNTTLIPIQMEMRDFYHQQARIPNEMYELFAYKIGQYPIDAIATSRPSAISAMKAQMSDNRRKYSVPIHLLEPLVRVETVQNEDLIKAMSYGYSQAHNWFLNKDEQRKAFEKARRYLSPSAFIELKEKSYVQGLPLKTDEMDEIVNNTEKREKFTLFWGARMSREKNPKMTAEIMEKFFSGGRDCDLIMTTQQVNPKLRKSVMDTAKGAVEEIKTDCPRSEFLSNVASSHMFLCTSDVEGFPTGFLEQLYVLQVGLFPDKQWVRDVLPEDYPYIYKNRKEAHTIVRWVHENYDEAVERVSWIRDWIRENYDHHVVADQFIKLIEETRTEDDEIHGTLGSFRDILDDCMDHYGREFSYQEMLEYIQEEARSWRPHAVKYMGNPNCYEMHRYILANGYKDNHKYEYPHYERT